MRGFARRAHSVNVVVAFIEFVYKDTCISHVHGVNDPLQHVIVLLHFILCRILIAVTSFVRSLPSVL